MEASSLVETVAAAIPRDPSGTPVARWRDLEYVLPDPGLSDHGKVVHVKISTLKVLPTRKGRVVKYGSDDDTYETYPTLAGLAPRCLAIARLQVVGDDPEMAREYVLHGMRKFPDYDGDFGFDDPDGNSTVLLTEKANGKCACLTVIEFDGDLYLFGGSKGVHYVLPFDPETSLTHLPERALRDNPNANKDSDRLVLNILNIFLEQCRALPADRLARLVDDALLDGYALCGELLDGMHFVTKSIAEEPDTIVYYGMPRCSAYLPPLNDHPVAEYTLGRLRFLEDEVGLPVVKMASIPLADWDDVCISKCRNATNTEGFVLHVLDGDGRALGTFKLKSWWYVALRVIRTALEKTPPAEGTTVDVCQRRVETALRTRNREYMQLEQGCLEDWIGKAKAFVEYACRADDLLGAIQRETTGFGAAWRAFECSAINQ